MCLPEHVSPTCYQFGHHSGAARTPLGYILSELNQFVSKSLKAVKQIKFCSKFGKKKPNTIFAERDSSVWLTLWVCASTNCYLKKKDYSCATFLLWYVYYFFIDLFNKGLSNLFFKGPRYLGVTFWKNYKNYAKFSSKNHFLKNTSRKSNLTSKNSDRIWPTISAVLHMFSEPFSKRLGATFGPWATGWTSLIHSLLQIHVIKLPV